MAEYPKRDPYYAHQVIRVMTRVCAAQDIGADAFVLVTVIAHTEDAKRYKGPVTFWNEQLRSVLGFSNWGKLDRARKKAIEGGWLHYEAGGKGKVGRYWVDIPTAFEGLSDDPVDEDCPVILSTSGETTSLSSPPVVKETGEKSFFLSAGGGTNEAQVVKETGDKRGASGDHSNLSLRPTPKPKNPPKSPKGDSVDSVPIPSELDTPAFGEAWADWQKHRREIRKPLKKTQAEKQLRQFADWGVARAIAAIEHTITMGWQGIREPEGRGPPTASGSEARPITFDLGDVGK